MSTAAALTPSASPDLSKAPTRLHHFNFVCRDHNETRNFYEGLLGIPLVAFYCEIEPVEGIGDVTVGHAMYGLADGSQIAIMHFPNPAMGEPAIAVERQLPNTIHLALHATAELQEETARKLKAAGVDVMEIDHGMVKSIYFTDPNGITIEYTVDPANHAEVQDHAISHADENFRRYMDGDHSRTNIWYPGH